MVASSNVIDLNAVDMTLSGLRNHYQRDDFSPEQLVQSIHKTCGEQQENPVWIRLLSLEEVGPYLGQLLQNDPSTLPLYGVPFAIKDNIDLAGIPTTAACPDFAYVPKQSAFVMQQLIDAGAIPIGKTNMDQFATGLVGTRSPYGACHNALNSDYVSGGSSSGSAVAVANHWVSFSLGTDTAGSGRVPAAFNNIVGLKPSRGLLSARGVVPACRSLDCVSIFALSVADANAVFDVAAQFDSGDSYARKNCYGNGRRYFAPPQQPPVIGIPRPQQQSFFGNDEASKLFDAAVTAAKESGATIVPINFEPFIEAAKLLYEGPWVAERYLATKAVFETSPQSLLPVIATIIGHGNSASATDAFAAQYRLQVFKQQADAELDKVDAIMTPTAGTTYKIHEVERDPIQLNSNLGYYTNFMNLLDCTSVAVPTGFYANGVGFGTTFFHRAFKDKQLLSIAALVEQYLQLPQGVRQTRSNIAETTCGLAARSFVDVVVCGAHLEGLPLNWQLTERGATLVEKTQSSLHYKLYALPDGPPFRPAMVRTTEGGAAIEVEVWRVPVENFGSFVADIPAPLGIGKVELADGRWESGFICEALGIDGAIDVTEFGGWRNYLARL